MAANKSASQICARVDPEVLMVINQMALDASTASARKTKTDVITEIIETNPLYKATEKKLKAEGIIK